MFDSAKQQIVRVIGHRNPDTDSICSAISYAYLKNRTSDLKYEARRAGEISKETEFVLKHFDAALPRLSVDMSPIVANMDIREEAGIDKDMSLRAAWERIMEHNIDTLCITDEENKLLGLITVRDIANAYMDVFDTDILSLSHTGFKNLLETLDAKLISGSEDAVINQGRIRIGTSPEVIEDVVKKGDIVLVTNRYECQMCAIDCGASCLILCNDAEIRPMLLERAIMNHCSVIATTHDTYEAARLISMAAPVRHFMRHHNLQAFHVNTPVEDARKIMVALRHRFFPVLYKDNQYVGMISRANLLDVHKKKCILVDHNEESQAVDGIDGAEILEIIDHHRIGTLETGNPVYFRNEPVGCTATIIYTMFEEKRVEIPKQIAGLLLAAILSDTMLFHSPTCTLVDKAAAKELAAIAGEDIDTFGQRMFEAGEDLSGRDADDILHTDYKEFEIGDTTLAVGQGFFMSYKARDKAADMVEEYLPAALKDTGAKMIFYMCTSISDSSTLLLYNGKVKNMDTLVSEAFGVKAENGRAVLPDVVSRKKQFIPPLRDYILHH